MPDDVTFAPTSVEQPEAAFIAALMGATMNLSKVSSARRSSLKC